jgi:hypothetical protein
MPIFVGNEAFIVFIVISNIQTQLNQLFVVPLPFTGSASKEVAEKI